MNEERSMDLGLASLCAVLASATLGLLFVAASVTLHLYGGAMFLALPVAMSALSAFVLRLLRKVSFGKNFLVTLVPFALLGAGILCLGLDGAICLLMALPLALVLALPGALLGHACAAGLRGSWRNILPVLILFALPAFLGIDRFHPAEPPMRTVTSRVFIDAPIERVWDEVIAFDRITKPPDGIFRWGIAYPIQAHIYGQGVGAVRHCIFSTGPFVEPITIWQPPHRLEFDVTENPPPLMETSPYGHIDVPHLHGTFVSRHGRFLLREEQGKVVLEGTTWYAQKISPDWYWHHISDAIVHRIHRRVLEQIREQAETRRTPGPVVSLP